MRLTSEVFPEPVAPIMANLSPFFISIFISVITGRPVADGYLKDTFLKETAISALSSFSTSPETTTALPAVLSVYFDLFSGGLQAYIFAMLTMMNVTNAFPAEDYFARQARKNQKNKNKNINKQTEVI